MCRQHRSLRAWRKLVIAFRSAAHMNDEDRVLAYTIDNSSSKHGSCVTGYVLTDIVSLQQTCHDNAEVYPNSTTAPCSLQGNG